MLTFKSALSKVYFHKLSFKRLRSKAHFPTPAFKQTWTSHCQQLAFKAHFHELCFDSVLSKDRSPNLKFESSLSKANFQSLIFESFLSTARFQNFTEMPQRPYAHPGGLCGWVKCDFDVFLVPRVLGHTWGDPWWPPRYHRGPPETPRGPTSIPWGSPRDPVNPPEGTHWTPGAPLGTPSDPPKPSQASPAL